MKNTKFQNFEKKFEKIEILKFWFFIDFFIDFFFEIFWCRKNIFIFSIEKFFGQKIFDENFSTTYIDPKFPQESKNHT